jgi:periplasmic protein TonB
MPMQLLRPTTWLLSLGLHAALLVAIIGITTGGTSFDAGKGNDTFVVEKGIALEGVTKFGDAEERIETVDIPPVQAATEPEPIEEIKPELHDVITSDDSKQEAEVLPDEPKPIEEEKPEAVPVKEQAPQVATLMEKSSGAAQHGGDTTARRLYLGALRKTLEKSKVNPRIHLAGTVLIAFTVSPSGQVLTREVKRSSGSKLLDEAAMAAIDKAAPFPPMPPDAAQGPIEVKVPFKFVAH